MTFTEWPFWLLTAVVFLAWRACRGDRQRAIGLFLTGSIVFYGYHHWPLLFLLFAYCVVDWLVGLGLERASRPRLVLAAGVAFNLLVLCLWKYTPLFLRTLAAAFPAVDISRSVAQGDDWTIPFGISFYAFTGIAYMVDVRRGIVPAERSFVRYALSAVFYPHLVAGPILRPDEFLTKLRPETIPDRTKAPLEALLLIGRGLFKKLVLADRMALAIDPFFAHVADGSTSGVWALPYVYLYALQIYLDFSGYTDIALGLGLLFGFRWPGNFDRPYLSASIQEFWRRWHMTLSRFLKDYLYVPLGGSRHGRLRTAANLMLTMMLGGLWHGASWSFLIWGGLHGLFLVINRAWSGSRVGIRMRQWSGAAGTAWRLLCVTLTFHCVCAAWCFFRLTDWSHSVTCLEKCLSFRPELILAGGAGDLSVWLLAAGYGTLNSLIRSFGRLDFLAGVLTGPRPAPFARGFLWGTGCALIALTLLLSPGGESPPFIYFRF